MLRPHPARSAPERGLGLATAVLRVSVLRLLMGGALVLGGVLACAPEDEHPGDPAAALVPADAAALEAYLKQAVSVRADRFGWVDLLQAPATPTPVAPESGGFSTTTLQTDGVDEADLVKFDGHTLFVARPPVTRYVPPEPVAEATSLPSPLFEPPFETEPAHVAVYTAGDDPADAEEIATIPLPGAGGIEGMLLLPESEAGPALLVVIGFEYGSAWELPTLRFDATWAYGPPRVRLWIFDVSDPRDAVAVHRSKLEGSLLGVRRLGAQLVLVTRFTPYLAQPLPAPGIPFEPTTDASEPLARVEAASIEELLPRRWRELPEDTGPEPLVPPDHCFVPQARSDADPSVFYHPTLVTISTVDLRRPDEPVSVCAAGPAERIYSSTRALYLAATAWSASSETIVHKFAYTEHGAEFRGSGRVAGEPGGSDPDFGLGELGDAIGIVTTVTSPIDFDRAPRLTLLAEARDGPRRLEELSHLPNEREPDRIGKPGEQLYAVRFVGRRIYAVTFRRIDPLYVIDAEDVRHPFIAGELAIPGFSDALHPIAEDLLLGVGKDSIEDGGIDWFQGVKVELFDVRDPSAPESVGALVIGRRGSDSAARLDHHALSSLDLGDGRSRVALPISVADVAQGELPSNDPRTWYPWSHTGLYLFEVDHDAPALEAAGRVVVAEAGDEAASPGTGQDRSRLQGDAVHYVHEGRVWSAPWSQPDDAVGPN